MNKTTKIILGVIATAVVIIGIVFLTQQKPSEQATETTQVKIAYLANSVNALPLHLAVEEGYFTEAGLDVEVVKFENPNQIIDSLLAGSVDFGAPSTAMGITAISQAKNPNTLKIFALNGGTGPNNIDNILLVKNDSTISSIQDLKGKKLGILPGIQFRTIAQHILSSVGFEIDTDVTIVELAIPLQLQALTSGQIDAVLTLEPVGTIGKGLGTIKNLIESPMSIYVADPWYGGGGVVSVKFAEANPDTAAKVIAVFDKAIKKINTNPNETRAYLKVFTPLNDEQIAIVPLPVWTMYTDLTESNIDALQKFFDIFAQYKIIENKVDARQLLYSN